jgi:hypothetical protein
MRQLTIAVAFMSALAVAAPVFACPGFKPPPTVRVPTAEKRKPKVDKEQPKTAPGDKSNHPKVTNNANSNGATPKTDKVSTN